MKASEVFGIVVRVCGLFIALNGLWYLVYVVFMGAGAMTQGALQEVEVKDYLFAGVAWLLAGIGLLRCAAFVVRFSYPEDALIESSGDAEASR